VYSRNNRVQICARIEGLKDDEVLIGHSLAWETWQGVSHLAHLSG
jgi:hypothetical protein